MKEKFKKILFDKKDNKKKIESLVFFLIILIGTLLVINYIWRDDSQEKNRNYENEANVELASSNTQTDLEKKLENILKKIDGVGEVSVLITYSESASVLPMYNEKLTTTTTSENDSSGGTRVTESTDTSKEVVSNNNSEPVTQRTTTPKVEGAIITAQGAGSASVKSSIISAVEAVTGVATHKIQVYPMSSR